MKKFLFIVIFMSILSSTVFGVRLGYDQLQWAKGNFDIPDVIDEITDVEELEPFLTATTRGFASKVGYDATLLRVAAIRKLGQLAGTDSIERLLETFRQEEQGADRRRDNIYLTLPPWERAEVIRTLSRINDEQVKGVLLNLLKENWEKMPDLEMERRKYHGFSDISTVTDEILYGLRQWADDEDVFKAVEHIINDEKRDIEQFSRSILENAAILYVKGAMAQSQYKEKGAAVYLLNYYENMTDTAVERSRSLRFRPQGLIEDHKAGAAIILLQEISEEVILEISSEVESEYNAVAQELRETQERFRSQLRSIEKSLSEEDLGEENRQTLLATANQIEQEHEELKKNWNSRLWPFRRRISTIERVLREKDNAKDKIDQESVQD